MYVSNNDDVIKVCKFVTFKGGESSSQFRWFTIPKIALQCLIFFVLILRLRLQRYSTNTKKYPSKKVFGNSEFCSSRQSHSSTVQTFCVCRTVVLAERTFLAGRTFWRGYLFVFVEYLCNHSLQIKAKNIKNCSSILAIVNHRNWLNDLPPLILKNATS